MRILVTGHKGFLGSEFVKRYSNDFEIVGYDLQDGEDLLDYNTLVKKMDGVEQVVHLAAIPKPIAGKTFDDYFNNNVKTTLHVLKSADHILIYQKLKRYLGIIQKNHSILQNRYIRTI